MTCWNTLSSEYVLHYPPWMKVRKERVALPNGTIIPSYFVMEFPVWVSIIPIMQRGIVLIRQYRHGLKETHFELPAGTVDAEKNEMPLEAAKRELLEETGYGGGTWELFLTCSANPALQDNLTYTFLAKDVQRIAPQNLEPSEDIEVCETSLHEAKEILLNNGIIQSLHYAALAKFFLLINNVENK